MNASSLPELAQTLAWAHWHALGIPGTARLPDEHDVDPEWLIAFSPVLAPDDARLRELTLAWCAQHHGWISTRRLRTVITHAAPEVRERLQPWLDELTALAPVNWGGTAIPSTHHSRRMTIDFSRPSLARLRARALFGVGAKADTYCAMLAHGETWLSVGDLGFLGYTRRTISTALSDFTRAQVLDVQGVGAGQTYRLADLALQHRLLHSANLRWQRWDLLMPWLAETLLAAQRSPGTERLALLRAREQAERNLQIAKALGWPAPTDPTWPAQRLRALATQS